MPLLSIRCNFFLTFFSLMNSMTIRCITTTVLHITSHSSGLLIWGRSTWSHTMAVALENLNRYQVYPTYTTTCFRHTTLACCNIKTRGLQSASPSVCLSSLASLSTWMFYGMCTLTYKSQNLVFLSSICSWSVNPQFDVTEFSLMPHNSGTSN